MSAEILPMKGDMNVNGICHQSDPGFNLAPDIFYTHNVATRFYVTLEIIIFD